MNKAETPAAASATCDYSTIAAAVGDELRAAEAKLSRLLDSREALIAEICHYLIDGGGKRLRPLFILLVYRACGGSDAKL
ncbi:MAG TPA: hypothetical protein VJN94_13780, partial [Candidatus Binataceae bacterium]|nr:hypothetical protein [Candidatus Binataceae bacterium]